VPLVREIFADGDAVIALFGARAESSRESTVPAVPWLQQARTTALQCPVATGNGAARNLVVFLLMTPDLQCIDWPLPAMISSYETGIAFAS
jgi:hypothetical protein